MAVPLLDLGPQHARLMPQLREAFDSIVASGRFILGPHVDQLEQGLSKYCGARHALGVSSGTDALLLAMMAMDIGAGDEVITSPFTFFATAGCIARLGAKPVFVDIDPDSFNIDPDRIEAAITPRTRAIMPVHLFGQTADMAAIMAIARRRNLRVIEDACQAIGAKQGEQRTGVLGDVAAFSFYPTKNLAGMGDSGALTTDDPDLHLRMKMLRLHGEETRYHHTLVGGNFRIDALQAAFLNIKLPHLDSWAEARRANAASYAEKLAGLPVVVPRQLPGRFHVFNQFTLRVPSGKRDELRKHLTSKSIGSEVYYPVPLHLQKCFASLGHRVGDFPLAERAASEVLSIPIHPDLGPEAQAEVVGVIREFFA